MRLALIACLLLLGCSADEKPRQSKAQREEATEAALTKTPVPRTYRIDGNQLLILDLPTGSVYGSHIERQRCYVWRDAEFKTSSIQCPSDGVELSSDYSGPEKEK